MIFSREIAEGPPRRALAGAGRRRLAHALEELSPLLRAEIVVLFAVTAVLLAYHAGENYYGSLADGAQETMVTLASRVLFGALLLATAILVQFAPRIVQRAHDRELLRAAPVPPGVENAWRSDLLALSTVPLAVLGLGLFLPPARFGLWGPLAGSIAAWISWLWASSQCVSLVVAWAPEGRLGPGGVGGMVGRAIHFLCVPLMGALYFLARETTALLVNPGASVSLWITLLIGLGLGFAARRLAERNARRAEPVLQRLAEHRATLEWKRKTSRRRQSRNVLLPGGGSRKAIVAWMAKDLRVALRTPTLRVHWLLVAFLKGVALVLAFANGQHAPWPFCGLLLVAADVVAGIAILLHWSIELPGWIWGSTTPRHQQWLARLAPPLLASLAASALLAAWAAVEIGWEVARPLALWTGISGMSLVVAAANLGLASPPRSPLGQNLYGLGLFFSLLVSAVYPVIGWTVLAAFALYTMRSLARDPRP
jgi:hypothetical protein